MATKGEKGPDEPSAEASRLEALVGANMLRDLWLPADFHHMRVRQVFGDNYRVDVFVGADAASARFAHSHFLTADGDGNVLTSSPAFAGPYY